MINFFLILLGVSIREIRSQKDIDEVSGYGSIVPTV
jgi:hypothetical protein